VSKIILEKFNIKVNKVEKYHLEDQDSLTREQVTSAIKEAINQVEKLYPYEGALEFLEKYMNEKEEIIIFITCRPFTQSKVTDEWIKLWGGDRLYYNSLIYYASKGKASFVIDNGIEVFIEDRVKHAVEVSSIVNCVILLDRTWNQHLKAEGNIIRMKNWKEIDNFFFKGDYDKFLTRRLNEG
jgi:uncharacterized HAD superfamily protein